jgi:hypothetical protein
MAGFSGYIGFNVEDRALVGVMGLGDTVRNVPQYIAPLACGSDGDGDVSRGVAGCREKASTEN